MHIKNKLHTHHYPPHYKKHKAYWCKWWQNGTRCRDGVKVLWCHSHLVWLVFEASIPTCTCFPSENQNALPKNISTAIVKFSEMKPCLLGNSLGSCVPSIYLFDSPKLKVLFSCDCQHGGCLYAVFIPSQTINSVWMPN